MVRWGNGDLLSQMLKWTKCPQCRKSIPSNRFEWHYEHKHLMKRKELEHNHGYWVIPDSVTKGVMGLDNTV